MIICITGTPGTGKTTLAKRLAKKYGLKYVDGNSIIAKYKLSEGYDKLNKCKIVDPKRFSKAILEEHSKTIKVSPRKILIVDSHLSHHIPKNKVAFCIVCKCNLKILKKRLKKRGYTDEKIRDNLDAEIFEVCFIEAQQKGHMILCNNNLREINKKINDLREKR